MWRTMTRNARDLWNWLRFRISSFRSATRPSEIGGVGSRLFHSFAAQSFITSWHSVRTATIFSGTGMVNVSPGREDMARRHCSNAGLSKKNRIIAGSLETFATPIQFPCGMKTVAPVPASYSCPANVTRTAPLDEYDFIFVQMLVGRNFVSRWHLLCTDYQSVRPSGGGIDLEDQRLVTE